MIVHVVGAPGSGKTTLAQALARDLGLPFASVDDERRKLLRPGQSWPSDDSQTWDAMRRHVESNLSLVVETMGGTANSARLLEGRDVVTVLVSAPDRIRHERIRDRARLRRDPMIGRPDKYVQQLTKIPAPQIAADAEWTGTYPIPGEQYDALLSTLRQSVGETSKRSPLAMIDMTVKFAEGSDDIIEGYGVPFGLDLDGQQFSAKSDLCLDWFPNGGRPILFHHGFDETVKMAPIGHEIESTMTDNGLWVRAQLDKASKYYNRVKQLVEKGAVGWSSGAPDHKVKIARDGHIDRWPAVEFSLTPTPAKPNVVAYAMKSEQAAELMPADIEPTHDDTEPVSLADQSSQVLGGLKAWVERMEERSDFRAKSGRELSRANVDALREAHRIIGALLERNDRDANAEAEAAKAALELRLALTET